MKGKLPFPDDLIIELIPFRERGKLWPGEFGDRAKVKTVDHESNEIRKPHKKSYNGECNGWPCQENSDRHPPRQLMKHLGCGKLKRKRKREQKRKKCGVP